MADYYFDPLAAGGGSGLSDGDPFNTLAATIPGGAHRFMLRRGRTFNETFLWPAATNNSVLMPYGDGPLPVIDCQNTRATGVNFNSRSSCEVWGVRIINQNGGAPDGGIRISGSNNYVHHCEFANVRIGVHGANTAGHRVEYNRFDIGNPLTPNSAFAVRFDGVSCTNNRVRWNYVTSTAAGMTFMASLQLFNCGAGNRIEYNELYGLLCDGPSLRSGTTGCFLVGNLIHGPRILDALAVEGSSNNFIWNNTAVNSGDVPGHFGPALKMGDEFSTGTPSANNDVANNLWVSLGANNCMILVTIGAGNTFRNNRLWRPSGGNIVNLNTGSGTSQLTFAAWQAAGFSSSETFGDPLASRETWQPLPGSPLLAGGVDLGFVRDLDSRQGRRFVGARAAAQYRPVAA